MIAKPKFKAGNYIINIDNNSTNMRIWKIIKCYNLMYEVEKIKHTSIYFKEQQHYTFGIDFLNSLYEVIDNDKLASLLAVIL